MNILEIADLKERVTFLEGKLERITRAILKLIAVNEKFVDRMKVLEKEEKVESAK